MPYYGDTLSYYYGGPFSNHSSLMTGTGRTLHSPLGSTRYAPHLTTISESPLSTLRRYSPAATITPRPKRIIDTADIDVSTPRALTSARNNNEQRNCLRRDRPTIRIRSQALKDNPALREHYERHEKTVGELLVEKFLIKDKKGKAENESRTKLYTQISLDENLTKKDAEEFQEAIQRRITRRMTRRRSSADMQMGQEQLEREVLFAQAQADALDTLVAEEQAEIEVEVRMGTLIRKNLVRTVAPLNRSSRDNQGLSGEEGDDTRTKKLAKKVKKRKKMTDKPSPPSESDLDSEHDVTRTKKATKERNEDTNVADRASMILSHDETPESLDRKAEEENSNEKSSSPLASLKFKIEASNSVGDFSTFLINASNAEEHEKQRKHSQDVIEQYRASVRLPAPKQTVDKTTKYKTKDGIIEEHQQTVVIPVKKRYVKDDARNSVYLTLKTQKGTNVNKMNDTRDKIDMNETIDDKVEQSTLSTSTIINGITNDAEGLKNISSMADNTTSVMKRQPRINKVAKFRSKDITESDVEVKSISELTTGPRVTKGKIGKKNVSLKNLSAVDDDTRNVAAIVTIGETSNRDKNERSSVEFTKERSNDRTIIAKLRTISKDAKTNDEEDNSKIDTNSLVSEIKALPTRDDKIPIEDVVAKISRENEAGSKIGKPLIKRAKKNTKDSDEKISNSISDESKRIKRSVASSLDSSNIGISVENSQERINDEKVQLGDDETEPSAARIPSAVAPFSNLVVSLPNASTINSPDVTNGLTIATDIQRGESNVEGIENEETRIDENLTVNDNLSSSQKITGKVEKTRSEISKTIDVIGEKSEIDELVKEEARNIFEQPTTIESLEILTPTKSRVNFTKNEIDENLTLQESQKVVTDLGATTINDDKNVVELPKLRRNRKLLAFSLGNNSAKVVELSSSNSSNIQVVGDVSGNNQTNECSVAWSNDDEITSPKIEKHIEDKINDTREIVNVAKKSEGSLDKRDESVQIISEASNLTNGISDKKPNTIVEIKKLATADSKIASKVNVSCSPKEEEIDFWGEIASDAKSFGKCEAKIDHSKEATGDNCNGESTKRDGLRDSMVTVLKSEKKNEALSESGTREETLVVVADAKKSNKVKTTTTTTKKKKKPSEDGGCKKKDQQEKASTETIFERLKISVDVVDEEAHQRAELLEQQSKKLFETNNSGDSGEVENICEATASDKFGRNLSTIVEESTSPITEGVPKSVDVAFDDVTLSLIKKEEGSMPKLDVTKDSSSLNGKSEGREETWVKDIPVNVSMSHDEPAEVTLFEVPVEPETKQSTEAVLPNSKKIVPSINIIISPSTPSEEDNQTEVKPEEVLEDEADEEQPGTPTNEETIDVTSKKIAKWDRLADLSLDEPDKDIGPEVALAEALKESGKKKTGDKKKTSKKSTNSTKSNASNQDSSKKKKLGKKKKSSTKILKTETERKDDERSSSQVSNSSDTTLKPNAQNLLYSPKNSGCNSPKQRPLDLIKMFYTTPVLLLTATPRDLSKVRRAKIKKRKHSSRTASASSDSTGSTRSTQSTGTAESTASTEHEDDTGQKRISSTRSNDSGFDGSPRLSNCDMACHKKCEKLTGNLCGLNQKLVAEALQALKRAPSQSSDNQRNSDGSDHHASGRITPPATNLPRFKKYTVTDFNFLKVLGKGSFGKVLLAELRRTDCVYAVKCLKKDVVLEDDDVECTLIERKVLTLATRHPYLCHLFCTFQTDSHLFFVMEYLNGGDLMFHIQKSGRFAESRARFYAAEIWSGLNFLHKKGIVYRDLKLDNVLLDFEGHIRIADFGMCKLQIFLDRTADTFCGTPDYMAPEIIKGLKYNQAVDWWSFGVLLYEMLTGQSPFSGCDEDELFWSICNERPFIPRYLSQEAMDVLICLLEKDAGKRPPAHEISVHPFFHSLQWDRLERRQLDPPFKPALEHTLDTRYFDTAFTAERPRLTPVPEQILTSMDQGVFRGFSYTNPNATD